MKGKRIEITEDSGTFETIKTIQKLPQIDEVVIETEEGSKKTISLDYLYTWEIDKKKDRVKPQGRLKHKKGFK